MKHLILILVAIPYSIFSQDTNSALSISGGAEYQEPNSHAWNVEINYLDRINNTKRFWTEFGVNYSILEYKGDSGFILDSTNSFAQIAFGEIYHPGYVRNEVVHYSRSSILRFQAGANYSIIDQEKIKLTSGINLVTQITLNHREHGQHMYQPYNPLDTLQVIDTHYEIDQHYKSGTNMIAMYLQPHVDLSIPLVDNLWFTTRFAYYHKILSNKDDSRLQLNIGLRYNW